jgi:hypothetical protein
MEDEPTFTTMRRADAMPAREVVPTR